MKKTALLLFIALALKSVVFSQVCIISGYVEDKQTGERLIGANIYEKNTKASTSSNNFGFYSISFPANQKVELLVSFIGYKTEKIIVLLTSNQSLNFVLEQNNEIEKIDIIAKNRFKPTTGTLAIETEQLKMIPSITGEKDIMKAYQLMPGVQGGKEGTTGMHVRGGSPDQNLVLLDDIPLYYVNHIGGFFSVFDTDIIKNSKLIKSGFPARYGGRTSAVLDIRMNDGNKRKSLKSLTLGILSSKMLIESPVVKGKSSFVFSARRSNIDLFTGLANIIQTNENTASYRFYDIYSKFNHKFSDKNQLFFSFYNGNDKLMLKNNYSDNETRYNERDKIMWGNLLLSVRLNQKYNSKLYSNITFAHTRFKYTNQYDFSAHSSNNLILNNFYSFQSGVNDFVLKTDYDYYSNNNHNIKTGMASFFHSFKPADTKSIQIIPASEKNDTVFYQQTINAVENYVYAEDEIKINRWLRVNSGVHFSSYHTNKKTFYSFQPRLIINIKAPKKMITGISYSKMTQYMHLLSNTGAGLPSDLWIPSTYKIKPQNSYQYSFYFAKLFNRNIEINVETYYKILNNLIDYKEGASLFGSSNNWQEKIETNGKGKSYGAEFLIKKTGGVTTGWLAYTISKTQRHFSAINNGLPYPYKYDRTHSFSAVINHQFNKKISLSAVWVYTSGSLMTLAVAKYNLINFDYYSNQTTTVLDQAHIYNGKNTYRLPAYHRLDLGVNFTKQKTSGTRILSIGVYNVYNRQNPYYVFLKPENNTYKLYQQSLFPIIPSISYSYKF